MRILFLLFVLLPVIEIWLLLQVGSVIGVAGTLGLIILSAIAGSYLLRQQGLATFLRARERLQQGEAPARELVEGLAITLGGAMLLAPGFVTDAIGLACLLPPVRGRLARWLMKRALVVQPGAEPPRRDKASPDVIEGEYRREDD